MKFVYLILATVITILFLYQLNKGKKYYGMLVNLDDGEYPIKGIYCAGLAWMENSRFALKGKMRERLMSQAKLLYDAKYAEYYASIVWAQTISVIHITVTVGSLLAGITGSGLMLLMGLGVAAVFGYYFINRMQDLLNDREQACTEELPEIVSTMALLINAGMMLREAWHLIAEKNEGIVYTLMQESCMDMDNGMTEVDAIHQFGKKSNSKEVRKFTSALAQSMERGGGELSDFLGRQSMEIWTLKKQLMLQKGEAAASKLLAPTALLFVGIIIAVLSGAAGMLI